MECIEDPDFDSILEDFLDEMPFNRDSMEEMFDIITGWDLWPVYNELLTDYRDLLTPDEITKLKADYEKIFSIPLPGEEK